MKRFLMLLAVAAIAGVMYVAAAPGSALHAGPTWNQFSALKKQVASLKKQLGQVSKTATHADGFIRGCFQTNQGGAVPVGLFGDVQDLASGTTQTFGFHYLPSVGGVEGFSTAFNVDTSTTPQAYIQAVDPTCITPAAASPAAGHLMLRTERTR